MVDDPNGFRYWVPDEQLRTFASLSPARRLQWLEELRETTFKMAPPHAIESWRRLRRGC
jgi:hypothetical protein